MIWDMLKGELIDVIDWTDDTRDTMVWRFQRRDNAIKYGAKLTVREGQAAVFIHEGQLADVFQPGLYQLETNNMPIMTTLQHWDHGFSSPFKSEIYFVSTRRFQDLKWGTKNPIMMRDPEFGPVRMRAFGTYSIRVTDPGLFLQEVVGTDGHAGRLVPQRDAKAMADAMWEILRDPEETERMGRAARARSTACRATAHRSVPGATLLRLPW